MIFYVVMILLVFQRLLELRISSKNFNIIKNQLIHPVNKNEKIQMILFHSLWFISTLLEYHFRGEIISSLYLVLLLSILIILQLFRFHIIKKLSPYWVIYPVAFTNQKIITSGPYRFIRHPNYLIVILEIFLYPLLGGAYFTSLVFGILHLFFIVRRINLEENELNLLRSYQEGFSMKKKLIPLLFSFLITLSVGAKSLEINNKNYEEAKANKSFFQFAGKSTKFGLVTTTFEGYVKKFALQFDEENNNLKNIELNFLVKNLDTDNDSRNEKMWDLCLEEKKHPKIKILVPQINLKEKIQQIPGTMILKDKNIQIVLYVKKMSEKVFLGETKFKLSELGIADPSIFVAKVSDEFKIFFQVDLTQ